MASAKAKNDTKNPTLKIVKNTSSKDFRGKTKDLWLGIERRKFSYTIYIPERRSNQNRNLPNPAIQNSKDHTKS
jgi:hypothetical protein